MASALMCGVVNSLGGFIFGYFAVGIHPAEGMIWACMYEITGDDSTNVWARSGITTMVNVGAMVGALSGSIIINKIGFRGSLMLASVFTACGLWTGFAPTYLQQVFARILAGFGLGLITSTTPSYIDKYAPTNIRGTLGTLFQVNCTLGILVSNVAGYFFMGTDRDKKLIDYCHDHSKSWLTHENFYLIIPALVLTIVLGLLGFMLSEDEKKIDAYAQPEQESLVSLGSTANTKTPLLSWIIGIMGAVALQLTGINAVMFFGTSFFKDAGFEQLMLGQIFIGLWNFFATLIALSVVGRFGRRKLLLPSLFLLCISLLLLSVCDSLIHDHNLKVIMNFILLVIYIGAFEMGPGCLFWVICNEIFPSGSPAFATMNGLQWMFTLIVTATFPGLRNYLNSWVFLLYSVFAGIAFVFHLIYLPETKGMDKNDLMTRFRESSIQGTPHRSKKSVTR